MWGEATSAVAGELFEHSGKTLVFLGPCVPVSLSAKFPKGKVERGIVQLLGSVRCLMEQGTCFHVLCQTDISRLLKAVGFSRRQYTVLAPTITSTDDETSDWSDVSDDDDPVQAALQMGRALASSAKVLLALDVEFDSYPATDLCSLCALNGGLVHLIGIGTAAQTDASRSAATLLASFPSAGRQFTESRIFHQFPSWEFLHQVLQGHYDISLELDYDTLIKIFQTIWQHQPVTHLVKSSAKSDPKPQPTTKTEVKAKDKESSTPTPLQADTPDSHPTKTHSKKKSKRKKSRQRNSKHAALQRLQHRLQAALRGLAGSSPVQCRLDLLDILTDFHLLPTPSQRHLEKCKGLVADLAVRFAKCSKL